MKKRLVASLTHQQRIVPHTSLVLLLLLESLRLKNGFAAYKLLMLNNEVALRL
ncbi:hypothetical protein OIU76_005066 [Salix suchowensis]|nr:hypothetical protein OIU76_005066 [Salix suchowensis]